MKKLLITGTGSYIGTSLAAWLGRSPGRYLVETVDMTTGAWQALSFSGFDSVFHVAGIAHVSRAAELGDRYYEVNRDLVLRVAEKARNDRVNQFIFMSSIIVYGGNTGSRGLIDPNTEPRPQDHYGRSKLLAEEGLLDLANRDFKIAIIRSPMVYGKGSKGNYPRLAGAARRLPFFPDYDNRRSMLHIDNLCEFVRLLIEREDCGLFFPQNREHVKTSELVRLIAAAHGKKIKLIKGMCPFLSFLVKHVDTLNKVFGSLAYEQTMSNYPVDYRVLDLHDSVMATESASELE